MSDEMIHIATHQRALSLLNYYRNKAKLCVCSKPNGRPRKKKANPTDVSITELKRERNRVAELQKTIDALSADRALLANEVIRWRAAYIRSNNTLEVVPDSKLREAIAKTNGRDVASKATTTNPIIRSRRPNDSDSLSAECKSLLPEVPKSRLNIETRSRLSEISRRDPGTDDPA